MNVCIEKCVACGDLAYLCQEIVCFPAVSLKGNQAIALCLMKCHVCMTWSAAVTHRNVFGSLWMCSCITSDSAVCTWVDGRCVFIRMVSRSSFFLSGSSVAEIGRNAWGACLRFPGGQFLGSGWVTGCSFYVAPGRAELFPCPACSKPRLLAASRLFLRFVCTVLLTRKINQSGEQKELLLMFLIIQRENGEAVRLRKMGNRYCWVWPETI